MTESSDEAVTRLADAIEDHVKTMVDHVTFAEFMNEVSGFKAGDDEEPHWIGLDHTVIWVGVTKTAMQAVWKLLDERRLCLQYTTIWPYAFEGTALRDKAWTPMYLRPGRYANIIGLSGIPFYATPRELKAAKRHIAKDKKLGLPSPVVLEAAT